MKITLRIWILIIFLILAVLAIYPAGYFMKGVIIKDIEANSTAFNAGLTTGEIIKAVDGKKINTIEDFYSSIADISSLGNNTRKIEITTNKANYIFLTNSNLGLSVEKIPFSKLKAGLDLQGGARALVKPERKLSNSEMQDLLETVRYRLNVYGVTDVAVRGATDLSGNNYMIVEMAGATPKELNDLIGKQGKFEAKIGNDTVFIGGERDVTFVCRNDASCASVRTCEAIQGGYYCKFDFAIHISGEAAKRFAASTSQLQENITSGGKFLSKNIDFYLDDNLVDSLLISADLKGKEATEISISGPGYGATKAEAYENAEAAMKKIQTILITGSLPFKIEIVKLDSVSPILGGTFTRNILLACALAIIAVAIIIFIRYKKIIIFIPIMITVFSEILLTLGIAALIKWNLDLASIAGIIAAIGTGVDDQIVMVDESRSSKEYSLKEKIKRAFTIILGAYATVAVSMLPLWWAGAGLLRGFAFTTIIGITVGVLITRPAFADIMNQIVKD